MLKTNEIVHKVFFLFKSRSKLAAASFRLILTIGLAFNFVLLTPAGVSAAAPTTSLAVVKYASDGTTIIHQRTVDVPIMKTTLPTRGDGITHYFHQGPTNNATDLWDPTETVNLIDLGAVKGTEIKDLCNLVGAMSSGDSVQITTAGNISITLDYANVYNPVARQGKICVSWYNSASGEVPAWADGIELVFLAQTTNTAGQYVFGNQDMHDYLPENRWYKVNNQYPSTDGYTLKNVNRIAIMSSVPPPTIIASAGANGSISPAGSVKVNNATSQTFIITPSAGCSIATLIVDGVSVVPVVANYTFPNVIANHTIGVTFSVTSPVVSTGTANNISTSSAMLNGNLTSPGQASTVNCFFEYGTGTSYGSTTSPVQSLSSAGLFSVNIGSLTPGTLYHFRARAESVNGTAQGSDLTFTTAAAAAPMAVATLGALSVAPYNATLTGNLTSLGTAASVSVFFCYYTGSLPAVNSTSHMINAPGPFSIYINGLEPGTQYAYYAVVTDGSSTVNGTVLTFVSTATTTPTPTPTPTIVPPAVTTGGATSLTNNSAT